MAAEAARRQTDRAMRSATNWTLLGLVIDRASYGWELTQRFKRLYGEVRPVAQSHVYAALDALEARGMIEIVPAGEMQGLAVEVARQPRPHYRATAFGRRSYEDWLVEQVSVERRNQELWVRQLAVFADDPDAALRVIDLFEQEYLRGAGKAGHPVRSGAGPSRQEILDALVDEQQRLSMGAMLPWLRFARELFERAAGGVRDGTSGA